jgi:RHS repeat-associated protein/uncharacterized repeat protein (TIGR02543 family)
MPGTECFDPGSVVLDASGFLPNWSPEPTPAPAPVPRPEAVDSAAWYGGYGWYGGFEERPDAGPLFFGRSAEQDREQSDASEYLGRPGLRAGEHETSVGRSGPGGGEAVASRDMRADPLTVLLGGTAAGTVTSTPAGITCAGGTVSCTGWFAEGDTVALTATPDTGMVFVGWAGACTGTDQPCEVTMNGAKSVVAHFASPLEFYHLDVLGSVRMVTNAAGAVVKRHDYFAFGEDIMGPEGDPRRFTAKERDAETELHYFGARYYRSVWGRFTSVDPVIGIDESVVDPQRWNRYGYSLNNPLRYHDPDGRVVGPLIPVVVVLVLTYEATLNAPDHWAQLAETMGLADFWKDVLWMGLTGNWGMAGSFRWSRPVASAVKRLPVPRTPRGMSTAKFGELMRWGTGSEDARKQIPNLTREALEKGGVTRDMAKAWAEFYRNEVKRNPANPSALGRAELMEAAERLLR